MVTQRLISKDQIISSTNTVLSDLTNLDEARATAPLVVQSYIDAQTNVKAHVVATGSIYKSSQNSADSSTWFAAMDFSNVVFNQQNSADLCIPVSGSVTMSVFDRGEGNQLKQLKISFSSEALNGASDRAMPAVNVDGDDANQTLSHWISLMVNRRCQLF